MFPEELNKLMNWQVLLFCLGIYVLVFIIRRIVDGISKKVSASWAWNNVILYVLPPLLGAAVAMAFAKYPYPADIVEAGIGGRIFYGLGCGWCSGWVYKVIKALVKKATGVDVPDSNSVETKKSDPPPPAA